MDLDVDVSRWFLELLLRDRDKESLAKRVLAVAPLSDHDWRLKKTLLLRSIESQIFDEASVGESILDSIESIEAIDREQRVPVTDAMRAAYCAVATELTVRFLVCSRGKPGGKYMEAVDRIWRGRVRVLEETEGCEMVTAEMKERRDEVEAGIWDMKVSKKLASLNSRNDALRLVGVYVKEAMAMLGPPFIAWAVRFSTENGSLSSEQVVVENGGNVGDGRVRVANGVDLEVQTLSGVDLDARMANGDNVQGGSGQEVQEVNGANDASSASEQEDHDTIMSDESESQDMTLACVNSRSEMERHTMDGVQLQVAGAGRLPPNENLGVLRCEPATKEKETPRTSAPRRRHGPARLRDDEDVGKEASAGIYNSVSSAEVKKVQEGLKSSVLALQAVVTDPLPYALHVSEMLRSELGMRPVDHVSTENGGATNPSVENNAEPDQSNNDNHGNQTNHQNDVPQPIGNENDAPDLSVDTGKGTENAGTGDANPGNPSCSHQNNVSRAGLMEHNSTARTYEWDDSLGMSPEQTNSKGLHLPSPKRIAVSPLKKYEDKPKRRKIKRWSLQEEDTLRTGVQEYGVGNWKDILDAYRDAFEERTQVDLKDKWRNMTR